VDRAVHRPADSEGKEVPRWLREACAGRSTCAAVLGSRHLKSGESIETGKKCHFPNYLIEICEAKNQKQEESTALLIQNNGGSTCNKMGLGASSTSKKIVSPQKFHGLDDTKSKVTASYGKPETDKVEAMAASCPGSLVKADSGFKEWDALYTTQLTQKVKKYHDGILRLVQIGSHARQRLSPLRRML